MNYVMGVVAPPSLGMKGRVAGSSDSCTVYSTVIETLSVPAFQIWYIQSCGGSNCI